MTYVSENFWHDAVNKATTDLFTFGYKHIIKPHFIFNQTPDVAHSQMIDFCKVTRNIPPLMWLCREMLDYTDRLMRDAISKIPDGEYKYVDYVDGCGTLYPDPININVRVAVSGEKLRRTAGTCCQDGLPLFHHLYVVLAFCLWQGVAYIGKAGCHILLPVHIIRNIACLRKELPAPAQAGCHFDGWRYCLPQGMME